MKKKRKKRFKDSPTTQEHPEDSNSTTDFHLDNKSTVVLIKEKIYSLVPTDMDLGDIKKMEAKDRPHVRRLNSLPTRTANEQEKHNRDVSEIDQLLKKNGTNTSRSEKVTSVKKAILLGKDIPQEIKELLKKKEAAAKGGDKKEAGRIRKVLRKLDYKRYLKEE